jgi:hypothetical protein
VARARCLANTQSEGAYNLAGRNCETVALWCVSGLGESLQRQRFQAVNVLLGVVVSLYVARLAGRGRLTRRCTLWISLFVITRVVLLLMYYRHNRRFYRDVRACDAL